MKLTTLAMTLAAGLLGFIVTTSTAMAVSAEAKSAVNVRTGPAVTFTKVDTLTAHEQVEVVQCQSGWCYVDHDGPDGWVSANFLQAPSSGPATPSNPNCTFQFVIDSSGPHLAMNCPSPTPTPTPPTPTPPAPTPSTPPQACFYTGQNYSGGQFCVGITTLNNLSGTFNNSISSVQVSGGAKARLCDYPNLGGYCRDIVSSEAALGPYLNDKGSSLRVFTGTLPGPVPIPTPTPLPTPIAIYNAGNIALQSSFHANLDNGGIVSNSHADIWYHAVNPVTKFLEPQNGAKLALGDGSNRGYAGCSAASYSGSPLPIWSVPVGAWVCYTTSGGRYGQFRLNGYSGTTMNLQFVTWK